MDIMKTQLRIGITGCTGALGQRLTELAAAKGHMVRCLVRNTNAAGSDIEIVRGDLLNAESLHEFVKDLDVCIHLAAMVSHASKEQYQAINVTGTENLCNALLLHNPGCRLIHCSTISVLRLRRYLKFLSTNYAISKYYAEKKVTWFQKKKGLKAIIIYPGLIFGPYDSKFIPFIAQSLKKGKVFLVSGGERRAPLIFIDDLCELFLLAAENEKAIGGKYVGVGRLEMGIHDFIRLIAEKTGSPIPWLKFPKWLVFPLAMISEGIYSLLGREKPPALTKRAVDILSINFAHSCDNDLGWQPKTTVFEGVDQAWHWYSENNICL
ncbi:NAD-dependent epimerase/dehydratase family protein [Geotalea uraniireducens]|uniref:NAD-dependent epimerase/dehydratase n=1 Tax=Geotalea uraniireducens (strain Rf4) TaxID=351605 RepID=A5GE77_GEOUR|nr:NAD-dependent epimerase/dehydratase family protein [Geotalea uraniireducens]ABQ25732.1 NAD-dependent epimerase/dehydratase [Geotalea uraniireducens Rf4]